MPTTMPANLDPSLNDADLAAALVRNAGALALAMRQRGLEELRGTAAEKTNVADVVTAADLAAESYIFEQLRHCRPADSIVGEEGAGFSGNSGRSWVIDPVDGTYNFYSGSSYWCSALALAIYAHDGGAPASAPVTGAVAGSPLGDADVLLGAIFQPQEDRLWLGGSGQPATLNGAPIAVDSRRHIGQLSAGTYIHPKWLGEPQAGTPWQRAAQLPATLRMFGSGSCDLGRVAQAELGVWFQHSCPAWDWLPGKGIVRAAGGDTAVVPVNGLDWFVAGPAEGVRAIRAALESGSLGPGGLERE
ncbi:inositol monophosphatase family protein [Arthrobacter sp. A2-55]|uniref:inositol monophosphatase family protein n=1 Tax=Arthrobacter sp. A2-55 TaxID=2897337 RepID=UPI0021CDA047|nr:inositol monophosphatase family protein [Arthrobacter sp. A2-55]MCU6480943.1 inositol monophosphatase family protein [Arthrobacter sp. A2-55]